MQTAVVSETNVGRVRKNNEDSFFVDRDLGLFVVCDGMGGHNAGEVASQLACEVLAREVTSAKKAREGFLTSGGHKEAEALRHAVGAAVVAAGKEIYKRAGRDNTLAGMGTTCTLLLLCGHDMGIFGQVGDSRLYVLRQHRAHQLTPDHTYVSELMRRGSLTRAQADNHPQGNVLSRALGVQAVVTPTTMLFDIDPDDVFLLCSDGLYNYFPRAAELARALDEQDLERGLATLIEGALHRGGHDNITAVAVRMIAAGAPRAEETLAARRILTLKRNPLFASLDYNELVRVTGLSRTMTCKAGDTIFTEEAPGDELYVILSGEVALTSHTKREEKLLAGAHFGEHALLDDEPRATTARALADTRLFVLARDEFITIQRSEPTIAAKLLWSFFCKLRERTPAREEDFEVLFGDDDTLT